MRINDLVLGLVDAGVVPDVEFGCNGIEFVKTNIQLAQEDGIQQKILHYDSICELLLQCGWNVKNFADFMDSSCWESPPEIVAQYDQLDDTISLLYPIVFPHL